MTASSRSGPIASAVEVGHDRRIDAARQPEHGPLEARLLELAPDELCDDAPGDIGVDRQLDRELERRTRRRSPTAGPRSTGRTVRGRGRSIARPAARPARRRGRVRRPVPGRVLGQARPLRHDPLQLAHVELRPLVAQEGSEIRSRRMSARAMSTVNSPSSYSGALSSASPAGPMTSEPPQNEIDSSTPTRLQKTTNEVVSWAYVRISVRHEVAVPSPTSLVAARSRPGDDDTLIRIWAPSSASSCGTGRCQKSSHTPMPDPTPEARRDRPQDVAGGEEAALVEEPVRREEELAVDVPDLAVLEQGGRDEQPVIARFLDERRRSPRGPGSPPRDAASRGSSSRIATSEARSWSW